MIARIGPTVSVVVPCYNSVRFVDGCFGALERSIYPVFETIAVDDGSTDGTADYISRRFPAVTVLRVGRNRGFAKTANLGMRSASGELIALLNVDTEVTSEWLKMLVAAWRSSDLIGIMGCRMIDAGGAVLHDGGRIDEIGLTKHVVAPDAAGPFDVEYACGAGLLSSRKVLERLGYLDEGFSPMYYEDVDLCLRARKKGWRICSTTTAVMRHYETNDAGRESERYLRRYHAGRMRFVLKQFPLRLLLSDFPRREAEYFLGQGSSRARLGLLGAYWRTLLRLPGIMVSRRKGAR